nr:hypothetical protein [Tanacetum cinerariifolium]
HTDAPAAATRRCHRAKSGSCSRASAGSRSRHRALAPLCPSQVPLGQARGHGADGEPAVCAVPQRLGRFAHSGHWPRAPVPLPLARQLAGHRYLGAGALRGAAGAGLRAGRSAPRGSGGAGR